MLTKMDKYGRFYIADGFYYSFRRIRRNHYDK